MVLFMVFVGFPVRVCAVCFALALFCICDNRIERGFALHCYLHLLVAEHMGLPCVVVRVRVSPFPPFLSALKRSPL